MEVVGALARGAAVTTRPFMFSQPEIVVSFVTKGRIGKPPDSHQNGAWVHVQEVGCMERKVKNSENNAAPIPDPLEIVDPLNFTMH